MPAKKIVVSAGDPSGDLILAGVLKHLIERHPKGFAFSGLCGPASQALGAKSIANSKDVAVVGIVEVLKNLPKIFRSLKALTDELKGAEALICVDFPDFNLRLAASARRMKIPVYWIVAPQVWAWRGGRLPHFARTVTRLYPALPFEEEIFREAGVETHFLGHPIRDLLPPKSRREAREFFEIDAQTRVFCIMPGSRTGEIARHTPIVAAAWTKFQQLEKRAREVIPTRVLVPLAPGWTKESWLEAIPKSAQEDVQHFLDSGTWTLVDDSRKAMQAADFGWIASGTATLEAALYGLKHVLFYKIHPLTATLLSSLSDYFADRDAPAGLPNILLGRNTIPELLQENLSGDRLAIETFELLRNAHKMDEMTKSLRYLPKRLGEAGATLRIAEDLLKVWNTPT
jgi:lipid-A-disaccharide synthase